MIANNCLEIFKPKFINDLNSSSVFIKTKMYVLDYLTFINHLLLIIFIISYSTFYLKFKHHIIIMGMLAKLTWDILKSGVSCIKITFTIIHPFKKYLLSAK